MALPGALTALALLARTVNAAAPATESFTSGFDGWSGTGTPSWSATTGLVQASFAFVPFPSPGENGALVATNTAAGGAFTGDYASAPIHRAGFDFLAVNTNPSSLTIEWIGGTNTYYRDFSPALGPTGVWTRIEIDFTGRAAGNWGAGPEDEASFAASLTNVTRFTVRIARRGPAAQIFQLDNLFIDRLPQATGLVVDDTNSAAVWSFLRTPADSRAPSADYAVQTSSDLPAGWTNAGTFAATGRTQRVGFAPLSAGANFRLRR